ncbi:ubiquitin-related domain-containing protein [Amylostereum chailletii]|nr:ubiquitin-related domain-containing protein [Amylostereum chailletii]
MSDNNSTGGRTVGGGDADNALPEAWARPAAAPRIGRIGGLGSNSGAPSSSRSGSGARIATFRDLVASGGGGHGHSHASSDDSSDDEDKPEDQRETWFAGGERSGLSVQNPDSPRRGGPARGPAGNLIEQMLRRAKEGGVANEEVPGTAGSTYFSGSGHTLGSDDMESTFIPDPNAIQGDEIPEVTRHLNLWRNGFSVEDGELMSYDDPAHQQILHDINAGLAPPAILNVQNNQRVQMIVAKRLHEDYIPSTRAGSSAVFTGAGHRLGSPVPDVSATGGSIPGAFASSNPPISPAPHRDPESVNTRFEVDQSKPTTSVQIRLADGTRMVARMNLTHTVQDLRNFINASRPENNSRPYTIGTTFPNRTLEDMGATIEGAGLTNSVIVQRWA